MPDGTTQPPLAYIGGGLLHGWWTHHRAGDLTRVIIRVGVSPDAEPGKGAEPPLITAVSMSEPDMVRALLDADADLVARGSAASGSATALAHAVHYELSRRSRFWSQRGGHRWGPNWMALDAANRGRTISARGAWS